MKKSDLMIILICFLLLNFFVILNFNGNNIVSAESNNKYYVDDKPNLYRDGTAEYPFDSIQQAIDTAEAGDTIYVFGGEYNESLIIDKELTLIGSIEEGHSIIYYGNSHRYTVKIIADNVNFTGFYLRDNENKVISYINGGLIQVTANGVIIQRNNISNCTNGYGILLESSDDNIIKDNIINNTITGVYGQNSKTNDIVGNDISNCSSAAIEVRSSDYNTLYKNSLRNNIYGVISRNCNDLKLNSNIIHENKIRGIGLYDSSNTEISNNTIYNNVGEGVNLNSDNCEIHGNIFTNNDISITLYKSRSTIKNNTILESNSAGIYGASGSRNNVIYLNKFTNNIVNVLDYGNNDWHYNNKGNYWDDYDNIDFILNGTCNDCNVWEQINHSIIGVSDGIGDTYYTNGGVVDKYPLGYFLKPPIKPVNPLPLDGNDNVGRLKIKLQVDVDDYEGERMDAYFYQLIPVGVSESNETIYKYELIDVDKSVESGKSADISFTQGFDTLFFWRVYVTDGKLANLSDIWYFNTKKTPGDNIAPVAKIIMDEKNNNAVSLNASNSYDTDGELEFYRWNFGDDTSEILSVKPTHTYEKAGIHTITLTVIDNSGGSDKDTLDVIVGDGGVVEVLQVDFQGSYSGKTVGEEITFVGIATGGTGLYASYSWDFGDDTSSSSGKSITHTYQNTGSYTVKLTVEDTGEQTQTATMTIEIVKPKEKKSSDDSPGFEFIIIFAAICIMLYLQKRNKK